MKTLVNNNQNSESKNQVNNNIPAADLVWDNYGQGCKVFGNIEQHAAELERMGGRKDRVTFKHNGTGRKVTADCYTFRKADREAVLDYFNKVMDKIANDFTEAWQADETHSREYREGEHVITIYGRGTVTVGGDGLKEPIAVRLDTPTHNYIYSLVGTPQTGVLVNAQQIASIELPEPPREVVLQDTCEIKAASKREQTQTGLQSAERERAQLKVKAVCIEGVSLTAEKRAKWTKNFSDVIRDKATENVTAQYKHDCGCIRVNVAYRNDSDKPEDWTYCVAWYKWLDIVTEKRELVECENGVRLEQAARAMADFHLLADAGLTLREILYSAA